MLDQLVEQVHHLGLVSSSCASTKQAVEIHKEEWKTQS